MRRQRRPVRRRPVRRNPDTHLRELERRAIQTGSDEDVMRWYWARVRAEGAPERERQEFPGYEIELPRLGPVILTPRGGVSVRGVPAPEGRGVLPVVVNRVDYNVSGAYNFIPPYGWIPFSPEFIHEQERPLLRSAGARRTILERVKDPTYRYRNLFNLTRAHWTNVRQMEASEAAFSKFMKIMDRAMQAWIPEHPEEMRIGRVIAANNDLVALEEDALGLREKLSALEVQMVQLILVELRNG